MSDLYDFESGDVVMLKSSHGVSMTVSRVIDLEAAMATNEDIGVHCNWFDVELHIHTASFHPDQLIKEEE